MTTFKKGEYYIGDPCYVVEDDDWIKLLEDNNYFHDCNFIYKGKKCYADGTAYGDGCYQDNHGEAYGVDAGLLGIIPVSIIKVNKKEMKRLGNVVKFTKDFNVDSGNGIFHFGNITINTRDNEDQEEDGE
jgi:hypothetical protein